MFFRLTRFIESHPFIHRLALRVWRLFPARLAGFGKGLLSRSWVVGAVAVMLDEEPSPPQILLAEHSYRRSGTWGLPGGSLESVAGSPTAPRGDASPDDVLEATLRREVWEELGIDITNIRLLRVDAVPYVREEPGPYRLDFYFRCAPAGGFAALREGLRLGTIAPRSPEIAEIRLVGLTDVERLDLFSPDARFLREDLPRLEPALRADPSATGP